MAAPVLVLPSQQVRLSRGVLLRHVLNLSPMILVHAGALAVFFVDTSLRDWLLLPLLVYVRGLVVTVGYHRYFAHRSFKTSRPGQFLLGCLCCANLQQGPLWWATYHRHHHRHSDDPGDPHSPYHGGFWWAYCGWLFIPLPGADRRYVRDLFRYRELVWLERVWQVPGLVLAALCWWGGWGLLCAGFCLSAVASFHLTFMVNTVAHLIGSRRYPTRDQSRNSFLLAAISLGDGWHNNHHHYPHSAQAGFFPWEIDGSYKVICLLERLGLVWDVRRVPAHKLQLRSEQLQVTPAPATNPWPGSSPPTGRSQVAA
jgi:stearoyl-CoA desaturase (delta-9 desaturase)